MYKNIANILEGLQQLRVNESEDINDTFERVANLIGATEKGSWGLLRWVNLDKDCRIQVSTGLRGKSIELCLYDKSKDYGRISKFNPGYEAREIIKPDDSDKKVMNKFEKLKKLYQEAKEN